MKSLKKLFSLFGVLLLLSSCTVVPASTVPQNTATAINTPGPSPTPTESPAPTDIFTEFGEESLPARAVIPALAESMGDNLYRIRPIIFESDSIELSVVSGSHLLLGVVTYSDRDMFDESEEAFETVNYYLISLDTCEVLCSFSLDPYMLSIGLYDGGIYTVNTLTLETVLYDFSFNIKAQYDGTVDTAHSFAAISNDGRYLLSHTYSTKMLTLTLLSDGKTTEFPVKMASFYSYISGSFVVSDEDGVVYNVDPEAGTCTILYQIPAEHDLYGNYYVPVTKQFLLTPVKDTDKRVLDAPIVGEEVVGFGSGCVVTATNDGETLLRFYNLRTSSLLGTVALEEGWVNSATVLNTGMALIIFQPYGGFPQLLMYDMTGKGSDAGIEVLSSDDFTAKCDAIIRKINEQTNVNIYYGSRGNDFIIWDYIGRAVTEEALFYSALNIINDFFNEFPEGMIKEMTEFELNGMDICLCGDLYGVGSGISRAGAVTSTVNNRIVIAADINTPSTLRQTLAHEFSHAFERRINYLDAENGHSYIDSWVKLLPKNKRSLYWDSYLNSNGDTVNDTRYTAQRETNPDRIWFVDAYSRSFPTEDRARIFENLFISDEKLNDCLQSKNLQRKARYYCLMLRAAFPSCASAEALPWEKWLDITDIDEFKDILNNPNS